MCFISRNKTKYIAKEDIMCEKFVDMWTAYSCVSHYTEFMYEFGKKYTLRDCVPAAINPGYHPSLSDPKYCHNNINFKN